MRHRSNKKILGRKAGPRKALMRSLATALVTHERMETTLAKAKVIRPYVEKLVTKSKAGNLAARRELMKTFTVEQPVKKLLEVLGPRYANRAGGYLRITKLGHRQGDAAETALIEFV
jgi:large subunit ribosomal protein L17